MGLREKMRQEVYAALVGIPGRSDFAVWADAGLVTDRLRRAFTGPEVVAGMAEVLYAQDNPTWLGGLSTAPGWKQRRYTEKAQALAEWIAGGGRA